MTGIVLLEDISDTTVTHETPCVGRPPAPSSTLPVPAPGPGDATWVDRSGGTRPTQPGGRSLDREEVRNTGEDSTVPGTVLGRPPPSLSSFQFQGHGEGLEEGLFGEPDQEWRLEAFLSFP